MVYQKTVLRGCWGSKTDYQVKSRAWKTVVYLILWNKLNSLSSSHLNSIIICTGTFCVLIFLLCLSYCLSLVCVSLSIFLLTIPCFLCIAFPFPPFSYPIVSLLHLLILVNLAHVGLNKSIIKIFVNFIIFLKLCVKGHDKESKKNLQNGRK